MNQSDCSTNSQVVWPKLVDHYSIEGLQLGEEKGRQEGERDTALKIARTILASGFDRESVMKMTGLTADDLVHIHH